MASTSNMRRGLDFTGRGCNGKSAESTDFRLGLKDYSYYRNLPATLRLPHLEDKLARDEFLLSDS